MTGSYLNFLNIIRDGTLSKTTIKYSGRFGNLPPSAYTYNDSNPADVLFQPKSPVKKRPFRHELSFWFHELTLRVTGWQWLARSWVESRRPRSCL